MDKLNALGGAAGLAKAIGSHQHDGLDPGAQAGAPASVAEHSRVFGANKYKEVPSKNFFALCWENLQDPIIVLLMAAATVRARRAAAARRPLPAPPRRAPGGRGTPRPPAPATVPLRPAGWREQGAPRPQRHGARAGRPPATTALRPRGPPARARPAGRARAGGPRGRRAVVAGGRPARAPCRCGRGAPCSRHPAGRRGTVAGAGGRGVPRPPGARRGGAGSGRRAAAARRARTVAAAMSSTMMGSCRFSQHSAKKFLEGTSLYLLAPKTRLCSATLAGAPACAPGSSPSCWWLPIALARPAAPPSAFSLSMSLACGGGRAPPSAVAVVLSPRNPGSRPRPPPAHLVEREQLRRPDLVRAVHIVEQRRLLLALALAAPHGRGRAGPARAGVGLEAVPDGGDVFGRAGRTKWGGALRRGPA
jgi:hypothetical protein